MQYSIPHSTFFSTEASSFENCTFEGNRAENGGAIHVWNGSNCELKNCQLSNNSAKNSSAINNIQADLILDNVTITKNVTKGGQGAVTISANGNMKATATFKNTVNIFDNTNSDSTKCEPGLEFSSPKSLLNVSALSNDSKIAVSRYSDYPIVSEWVFSGDIPAGVGTKNVYSTSKEATVIIKDNKFVWQVNGKPDEPTKPSGGHSHHSNSSSSSAPVQPQKIVTETGLVLEHYVVTGRAGVMNEVPLPYISSDVKYNGWDTINNVLVAYKQTQDAKTKPLTVTMNGFVTVNNELLKNANELEVDLAFKLDNSVSVKLPKQNSLIPDALKTSLDGSDVFLKISALTQINTAELANKTTGLNFADVQAIGGTANTPVVKVLTSNKINSLEKGKTIEIEFDTNIITDDAGNKIYSPNQKIYLYNGSDVAGVACYKTGRVGEDGKVRFTVPMVSSLWTVGPNNVGKSLFKL